MFVFLTFINGRDPPAEHYKLSREELTRSTSSYSSSPSRASQTSCELKRTAIGNPPPSKQYDHATKISLVFGGGLEDSVKACPYHGG